MYTEDLADFYPDPCPECGSDRTYWLKPTLGFYKCEDCNMIIDDDYWMTVQPKLVKGDNYPEDEES